jgi:hypothetical protein
MGMGPRHRPIMPAALQFEQPVEGPRDLNEPFVATIRLAVELIGLAEPFQPRRGAINAIWRAEQPRGWSAPSKRGLNAAIAHFVGSSAPVGSLVAERGRDSPALTGGGGLAIAKKLSA